MNPRVQELCPATTAALRSLSGHVTGDASFSVLQPGKVIPPHYGEINFRLTVHLPLVVEGDCGLEAGGERHRSREGECFVFDDGFLHHAWNHGRAPRVHLLFMIWNPEVTEAERAALEQLLASFHRPRRLPLGERLLRTLVEERVAERGADSADLSEVSAPAFREGVARLRAAADGLLADEVRGRLDLLDAFRQASLFPQLDWDAPPTPEGALTGAEALISRKPTSFALVEGASPTGGPTMVVVCGDRQIELEGPLVPVVREALSGEPFRVSTIAGALPDGAPRRAALHLLDVLRREGLLELVEPEG